MIGVETRTSAPVRILRDNETLQHVTINGLFPCGEGAGYAGGIVSAGIDGERCAEAVATYLGSRGGLNLSENDLLHTFGRIKCAPTVNK